MSDLPAPQPKKLRDAKDENVSASIQNQALNALLFLYRNVLQKDLTIPIRALRANCLVEG
jgi:hypothetical protein